MLAGFVSVFAISEIESSCTFIGLSIVSIFSTFLTTLSIRSTLGVSLGIVFTTSGSAEGVFAFFTIKAFLGAVFFGSIPKCSFSFFIWEITLSKN